MIALSLAVSDEHLDKFCGALDDWLAADRRGD
jgi:hypothetical protein